MTIRRNLIRQAVRLLVLADRATSAAKWAGRRLSEEEFREAVSRSIKIRSREIRQRYLKSRVDGK